MIRSALFAALLCVASIPAQRGATFGDTSIVGQGASVVMLNGEPMLVVIGNNIEIRQETSPGQLNLELQLSSVQVLARQQDVGNWWGWLDPDTDQFSSYLQLTREGLHQTAAQDVFRSAPTARTWRVFGSCDQSSASYYPCVFNYDNPLAAMVFRARLR